MRPIRIAAQRHPEHGTYADDRRGAVRAEELGFDIRGPSWKVDPGPAVTGMARRDEWVLAGGDRPASATT